MMDDGNALYIMNVCPLRNVDTDRIKKGFLVLYKYIYIF